jgi:cystathionine beta-lyase family protein involved in aluminum resistance
VQTKATVDSGKRCESLIADAEKQLSEQFEKIDAIALINQRRVLKAYKDHRLTEEHFAEHTGYGLNDTGRAVVDGIFAQVMQAEAAAVRLQLVSGTHAIACTLLGNLAPGDRIVCLTGEPYDTLHSVIGRNSDVPGSLRAQKVEYVEVDLDASALSKESLEKELRKVLAQPTKIAYVQKSCGYSFKRPTLSNQEIGRLSQAVKAISPETSVIVDNCYGEFVEANEPTACGADMVVGSLIKNPGGGLAICGGYFAGKKKLVEGALTRLTAPGIDGHLGITYNQSRLILQGLYLAPAFVANAVKGSLLIAQIFSKLGLNVRPSPGEERFDIIQAVELKTRERLLTFCRSVQMASPVNPHVIPNPAPLPGYEDEVIMAGGTFVEGATLELSADGPLRPPYVAYIQAGLSYLNIKYFLEILLESFPFGEFI